MGGNRFGKVHASPPVTPASTSVHTDEEAVSVPPTDLEEATSEPSHQNQRPIISKFVDANNGSLTLSFICMPVHFIFGRLGHFYTSNFRRTKWHLEILLFNPFCINLCGLWPAVPFTQRACLCSSFCKPHYANVYVLDGTVLAYLETQ